MIKVITHLPLPSFDRPARLTWAELAFRCLAAIGTGFVAGIIAVVVEARCGR